MVFLTTAVSCCTVCVCALALLTYSTWLLVETGLSLETAQIASTVMTVVSPVTAAIGAVLIDKVGRKPMLLAGLFVCVACLVSFSLSAFFHVPWGALAAVGVFNIGFAVAQSPRWSIPGELLPQSARGAAVAFGDAFYWTITVASVFAFLPWLEISGFLFVFLPFIVITLGNCLYFIICLPETKGRTIEDIVSGLNFYDSSGHIRTRFMSVTSVMSMY